MYSDYEEISEEGIVPGSTSGKAKIEIHFNPEVIGKPGSKWAQVTTYLMTDTAKSRQASLWLGTSLVAFFSGKLYQGASRDYFTNVQYQFAPFANIGYVDPDVGEWATMIINGMLAGSASITVVLPKGFNIVFPEEYERRHPQLFGEQQTWSVYFGQYGAVLVPFGLAIGSGNRRPGLDLDFFRARLPDQHIMLVADMIDYRVVERIPRCPDRA